MRTRTQTRLALLLLSALALCMSALIARPSLPAAVRTGLGSAQRALARRAFGGSSTSQKALPFSLRNTRESTAADGRVLRMLMFGKPGAGKGTLTEKLTKKYNILSLSTGDLLRQHIADK